MVISVSKLIHICRMRFHSKALASFAHFTDSQNVCYKNTLKKKSKQRCDWTEPRKTRKSSCVNARGIPPAVYWVLLLLSYLGTPPPILTWPGGVPNLVPPNPRAGYTPWQGTPPPAGPGRVPPPPWCLSHGILGDVAKHMGYGYPPPPVDRQMEGQTRVKTLPSRRTTYAGSKYC